MKTPISSSWKYLESLLIKDVFLKGKVVDVFIRKGRFEKIGPKLKVAADAEIDGKDKAILPSFANCHTRAAMNLMRGYADDVPAFNKMQARYFFPFEGSLSEDDVYWGTKLACLEMIRSGTTFFTDMYHHWWGAARAVQEMGMRSVLAIPFIESEEQKITAQIRSQIQEIYKTSRQYCDRIDLAFGPSCLGTTSEKSLKWMADYAAQHKLHIHTPLSRSQEDVAKCQEKHGKRPVHQLAEMGMLNERFSGIHALWLDDEELRLLAENGARVVHCPSASLKLACGTFDYQRIKQAGVPVAIGTDDCSSANRLNLLEETRLASLLAKSHAKDPAALPAEESLQLATKGAATLYGINNGEIASGKLADCILIDLNHISMIPNHNDVANLIYSADYNCIETTICNGRILMHKGVIATEEEILTRSREAVARVLNRMGSMGLNRDCQRTTPPTGWHQAMEKLL